MKTLSEALEYYRTSEDVDPGVRRRWEEVREALIEEQIELLFFAIEGLRTELLALNAILFGPP